MREIAIFVGRWEENFPLSRWVLVLCRMNAIHIACSIHIWHICRYNAFGNRFFIICYVHNIYVEDIILSSITLLISQLFCLLDFPVYFFNFTPIKSLGDVFFLCMCTHTCHTTQGNKPKGHVVTSCDRWVLKQHQVDNIFRYRGTDVGFRKCRPREASKSSR